MAEFEYTRRRFRSNPKRVRVARQRSTSVNSFSTHKKTNNRVITISTHGKDGKRERRRTCRMPVPCIRRQLRLNGQKT